jgi:CPA2 family monovalent cation:H+ antiporter-2
MEGMHFLRDLLIAFAVAGGVVLLFNRLRLPSVVGLLTAGIIAGPHGLGLIRDGENIHTLAEIGVVILLFAVGLEFSLPRLVGMSRLMARVGIPQVLVCVACGIAATWAFFGDIRPAVFAGMLLAMSSTAIVFKLLTDRGELASPQGNVAAAVLLFQDLLVVACMVMLPLLSIKGGNDDAIPAWQSVVLGAVVVGAMLLGGRYLLPWLLFQVVRAHNRELFLIAIVLVCLGSAALTGSMGWSLALGAFLAGLALSESEYATETLAEVLPFRDTLSSLFFVSVGMLLDLRFVLTHPVLVTVLVVAVVAIKLIAGGLPVVLAGYPLRTAVLTGLSLAQIGEFSFILADRGLAFEILNRDQYQAFLAVAVLTIALTPGLISVGPRFATFLEQMPIPERWRTGHSQAVVGPEAVATKGHVVIVGYGLNGRNLARVLRATDIPYMVLELNPETVRQARARGEPVYYGDCTRPAVLEHLGVANARMFVVAISDPTSSRRAVQLARRSNSRLHILVRTRYLAEVPELRRLGANAIIPEEFETSVEIFARVLREYEVPQNLILNLVERVREDQYEVLRDLKLPSIRVVLPHRDVLERLEIGSCWIRNSSPVVGKSIGELRLRSVTGATLVSVRRHGKLILNPGPDLRFEADDTAIFLGDKSQMNRAICMLDPEIAKAPTEKDRDQARSDSKVTKGNAPKVEG